MASTSTFTASSGDGYERLMGRWSRRLADPFLDFAGTADAGSALDAGCGTGNLSEALVGRYDHVSVTGIDLSPAYIRYAQERHANPRLFFQVGDICALPFADHSFDTVLSLLVLHFVPKPELALGELRRVARPGSTIAAAVWDARGGFVANRIFFDVAAMLSPEGNQRRARNYTRPMTRPGELANAFRSAGLTRIRETTLSIRMEFQSFDDYWAPYVGEDGPGADFVSSLDTAERRRLQDIVRASYLDGEPDGLRSYAAIAWAAAGNA